MSLLLLFGSAAPTAIGGSFGGDFPGTVARPEYVYLGLEEFDNQATEAKAPQVAKWRLASAETATGSAGRLRQLLAVSNGVVRVQGVSSWDSFDGPNDITFDPGSKYTWTVYHSQKVYIGDGLTYGVYDPKAGTLLSWESEGAGAIPEKCALSTVYRGRIVLARPTGQPTNWYMSAVDRPNTFDFFPPVITVDQAVFGNNAPAGLCPDIINTMIPHNDDYLIFGCDSSIWRMAGDPMEGGSFERLSDSTGMAFGPSWCKDPVGIIYFFGSKGGVYRMSPGGYPQFLSDARDGQDSSIQDRLTGIDLSSYRVELAWSFEEQGLYVYQIPYAGSAEETPLAYFWDSKNNAWHEDQASDYRVSPFCVRSVDGDLPGDRRVVLGCQDGWLREIAADAVSDDTYPIRSEVTLGPLAAGGDIEIMLGRIKAVLAKEQAGCTFEVYASDEPSELGRIVASGTLQPGQNPRLPVRRRGAFIWIVLRNTQAGERWALEELMADIEPLGRRKVRA